MNLLPRLKPAPAKQRIGDGAQMGIEIAGTLVAAFLIGWGLDSWLGTTPLFMLVLSVMAVVGKLVVVYYAYSARMAQHEAELPRRVAVERAQPSEAAAE